MNESRHGQSNFPREYSKSKIKAEQVIVGFACRVYSSWDGVSVVVSVV
jgi:hypothetical protein